MSQLELELAEYHDELEQCHIDSDKKDRIRQHLIQNAENAVHVNKAKIVKKLSNLYGGHIKLPESKDGYINLSTIELSDDQKEVLNLGLNCHYQAKYDPLDKKAELEVLYQDILRLQKEKKVEVYPNLKDSLIGEGSKVRGIYRSKLLSRKLFRAARDLRDDERIIVKRADKSSIYVIMDRKEYTEKLNGLLSDKNKFEKISKDPTDGLKAKVNRLITSTNAVIGQIHFTKIVGEYAPGYAYGSVKTHKPNNPLRPIISQVSTPTYKLAKKLNDILQPYVPTGHSIKSIEEFVDILRTNRPSGMLASIDVESLFTNVPVRETIQIILDKVYDNRDTDLPPLQLPRGTLEKLLLACTTESPFRGPDGQLYRQKDGIAMGSPLGPLFASFYMSEVEARTFGNKNIVPHIYCRFVDDIFVDVKDQEQLNALIEKLQENSVLSFTFELNVQNKLPFLDVLVKSEQDRYETTVYRKATDVGRCLNANSECPSRYKKSVIRAFIRRAIRNCSSWELLHAELSRVKQVLINNGYSNSEIDTEIKTFMDSVAANSTRKRPAANLVQLFYKNHMSTAYKVDERAIRDIIFHNVKCANPADNLRLTIYYQNRKTSQLLIRNSPPCSDDMKRTNVVYQFSCTHEDCRLRSVNYIGVTTTSLSRRLTMHLREGAPHDHMTQHHNTRITRKQLVDNTRVIKSHFCTTRLLIHEALLIRDRNPALNKQLKSCVTLGLWG